MVATKLPAVLALIDQVRRPRAVVMEEGPLSDWLARGLAGEVDRVIVCDPRRNRLIAAEGDKADPIDAAKLLALARGGYVRPVHHALDGDKKGDKKVSG